MADRVFHELHQPEDASTAESAVEVIRAWVIDQHLQCAMSTDVFPDHAVWGHFLADLTLHVVSGLNKVHGVDPQETLAKILQAYYEQLNAIKPASPGTTPEITPDSAAE